MFSHFTLGTNNRPRAEVFYNAIMPVLGFQQIGSVADYCAYARDENAYPRLFICLPFDTLPATWGNGFHIAFMAAGEDTVKRFHQAALAAGGYDEGAPGLRPHYAADYYAAYVRDPDGNKLQAVYYANGRKAGLAGDSISHITLGTRDVARAGRFYEAVLATLGLVRLAGEEEQGEDAAFGFKDTGVPIVFPQKTFDGRPATWGNGTHVAFQAANRAAVDAFYRAALSLGGLDEGAPALRPHYHTDYYAAYVRDPDGNKLQAVCHEQHRPI